MISANIGPVSGIVQCGTCGGNYALCKEGRI